MKALLIIDMQYDFLPEGKLAVKDGNSIISVINKSQSEYQLVVATQDWHPENHDRELPGICVDPQTGETILNTAITYRNIL